ncbi:MAG: anion permease, partial [Rickettsiales bacterium]|nr:anion permease [Rickettsiales bacterium]
MFKLLLGPFLFVAIYYTMQAQGASAYDTAVIATVSWMIYWWVVGVVPLMVTALLPIAILPLLNESTIHQITKLYSHPLVFLFLGGFMLAAAIEKCHLHKRIALNIIKFIGSGEPAILAGFMLATAIISMWISNTATTVLMLPIGLSVLTIMNKNGKDSNRFDVALLLGIAYSANIGGIATLIGTPPNAIFAAFLENTYGYQISFARWMMFAFPLMLFMLAICYFILLKLFGISKDKLQGQGIGVIDNELKSLGTMSKAEKLTLLVFTLTALAWMFRGTINSILVHLFMTPAEGVDPQSITLLSDASIAIMASIVLFCIPLNIKEKKFLMDWDTASRIPWGILLLFGGGLTAASLLAKTSIIGNLSDTISVLSSGMHIIISILVVVAIMLMMTEV